MKFGVGQRCMVSNGYYIEDEILTKFGHPTLIRNSSTFVVGQAEGGGLVVLLDESGERGSQRALVKITSSGSSKLEKGQNRAPMGGNLSLPIFVK